MFYGLHASPIEAYDVRTRRSVTALPNKLGVSDGLRTIGIDALMQAAASAGCGDLAWHRAVPTWFMLWRRMVWGGARYCITITDSAASYS